MDALAIGVLIVPASRHVLQIAEHRQNWSRIVDAWPSIGLQIDFFVFILLPVVGVLVGIGLGLRAHQLPLALAGRKLDDSLAEPASVDGTG